TGFFGINNEAINVVQGDSNDIAVTQQDGGHWFYNFDLQGSGNQITASQAGLLNEATLSLISGDENTIEVTQNGLFNAFTLNELVGSANEVVIDQDGNFNAVTALSMRGDDSSLEIEQAGDSNTASFAAVEGNDNDLAIDQEGDSNTFTSELFAGNDNQVSVAQQQDNNQVGADVLGANNELTVMQNGSMNETYLGTIGADNEFSSIQIGNQNSAHIANFNGDGNDVDLTQAGDMNTALIQSSYPDTSLTSNDNDININQLGSTNEATITFASVIDSNNNTVDFVQSGDLNAIDLVMEGSNHSIDIAQQGDMNMVAGIDGGAFVVGGDNINFERNDDDFERYLRDPQPDDAGGFLRSHLRGRAPFGEPFFQHFSISRVTGFLPQFRSHRSGRSRCGGGLLLNPHDETGSLDFSPGGSPAAGVRFAAKVNLHIV
ncbi:hypothetical protein LCGC14_2672630, partial [marine sediment metagenome]